MVISHELVYVAAFEAGHYFPDLMVSDSFANIRPRVPCSLPGRWDKLL